MKTQKTTLGALALTALLIFVGCQNNASPNTNSNQPNINASQQTATESAATFSADSTQFQMALQKSDASLCNQITSADLQEACTAQITLKQNAQSTSQTPTEQDTLSKIIQSGDYTQCKAQLKSDTLIASCETNILLNKALTSRDISWCEKASVDSVKTQCESIINTLNPSTSQANQ